MNFSARIYLPSTHDLHFNEEARCDNEVNLIVEKNSSRIITEQSPQSKVSLVVNQTDQYYFTPIQEQNFNTIVSENKNVATNSSSSDLQHPSTSNPFDDYSTTSCLFSTLNMNSSDTTTTTTVKQSNDASLTEADLAALFASSLLSPTSNDSMDNTFDEVFLKQMNSLVSSPTSSMIDQAQTMGPPPGFENFHVDASSTSDAIFHQTTNKINSPSSSISNPAIQTPVSSSDTINFSQLLQSTIVDPPQQTLIGNLRSSSHSSFRSDEQQSMFFPIYSSSSSSSSATSQMLSTNTHSTTTNSAAKPHIPNSLSLNSTTGSPIEYEKRNTNVGIPSTNSFFPNGRTDFPTNHSAITARTSSSTSSSSSIDDALIQLTQQQHAANVNKLFNGEPKSIFDFPSLSVDIAQEQEQAVHANINFLASMSIASTPVLAVDFNENFHRSKRQVTLQRPVSSRKQSTNPQELMQSLNELCYKGFDQLNALIQEQRWVQTYVNLNSSPIPSSSITSNCGSSRIFIVPEYFIFKCKKVEITTSAVFELLANGKAELRLRDFLPIFKSWKEAIYNAESTHQKEENKLKLSMEHPQSYYMTESVLQSAFDRISYSIGQLCHITQQARAAFQYATLNVFQRSSSQQEVQSQSSTVPSQFQAMQQQKSSTFHHSNNGSIRTTP